MESLTAEYLRDRVSYDTSDGTFTWKAKTPNSRYARQWNSRCAGKNAGYPRKDGYLELKFFKRSYLAHRLAWLYVTGNWPEHELDHIDLNRSNNRIGNLRIATHSENRCNTKAFKNNKSGLKGVTIHGQKWQAHIKKDKKRFHLGTFSTPQEAATAYNKAAKQLHGAFYRAL